MNRRDLLAGFPLAAGIPAFSASLDQRQIRSLLAKTAPAYSEAESRHVLEFRHHWTSVRDTGTLPFLQNTFLARNGPLVRLDRTILDLSVYIVGADCCWEYSAMRHEFVERPPGHPRAGEIRNNAGKFAFEYGVRFKLLDRIDAAVEFERWEDVRTKAGRHRCARIKLGSLQTGPWSERLWIDPETALIWKSVMERKARQENGEYFQAGTITTRWDRILIGEPPPETFVFRPPRNARKVEAFGPYIHNPGGR